MFEGRFILFTYPGLHVSIKVSVIYIHQKTCFEYRHDWIPFLALVNGYSHLVLLEKMICLQLKRKVHFMVSLLNNLNPSYFYFFQSAVALFDMVEYYESACKVNIAFNKNISGRGWQGCARMIRKVCYSNIRIELLNV